MVALARPLVLFLLVAAALFLRCRKLLASPGTVLHGHGGGVKGVGEQDAADGVPRHHLLRRGTDDDCARPRENGGAPEVARF